jgi:hypothetical protein
MSAGSPKLFDNSNLSLAWKDAFDYVMGVSDAKLHPVVLTIAGFEGTNPPEISAIREAVDDDLQSRCKSLTCEAIASTIFPQTLWDQNCPASDLFYRYVNRAYPRLIARAKKANRNWRFGTYFHRMIAPDGDPTHNQLAHVINRWNGSNTNNSMALQISCREPAHDVNTNPYPSFPCLQQIGISWTGTGNNKQLWLNAFYPLQDMVERAYGNYLGLCRLGVFLAHYMNGCRFAGLNCYVAKPTLGGPNKCDLRELQKAVASAASPTLDSSVGVAI